MKLLQDVRASYWFLPSVMALFAVLLAQLTLFLDHNILLLPDAWRTTQVDGARSTLAVISQSIIGVTGVMFSMTIVAVSFASGNFGPRLIGNFMRDRGNQISLGVLIATFVYTLLILRSGPVALLCRSRCSFKPRCVRKRRGFSSPVLSVGGADCRSH